MPQTGALKTLVYEENIRLPAGGLVILSEGNVSQISDDRTFFVIKPSGVEYVELSPEKMVVVDMQGRVAEGDLKPSVDWPTHLEIYKRFSRIGGIAHTHSPFATTFAQMRQPISCYGTTQADAFPGDIPVTRPLSPEEIEGNLEVHTAEVISEILAKEYTGCTLVANHGPFTFGTTAKQAVDHALITEKVAMMALLGEYPALQPRMLFRRHFERKHGSNRYYGQNTK